MTLVLAWNNVRTNRMGFAASFTAVLLAVMLVGGSGLVVAGAGTRDELSGVMGLLVLSAAVSGFVSIFVVAGMLSLHVLRQRRTWALLRSVGMTPGQVSRLITAEALVVAVLASAAGCVLAVPYAAAMAVFMQVTGLAPTGLPVKVTMGPFIVALAVGLVVTLLATRAAARKA
ncbi:ABC transporter permease, partial [Streptosporangium algeriense]